MLSTFDSIIHDNNEFKYTPNVIHLCLPNKPINNNIDSTFSLCPNETKRKKTKRNKLGMN